MNHAPSADLSRASVLACAALCAVSAARAANGTWTGTNSPGLWSDTVNWSAAIVADGVGSTADFSTVDLADGVFIAALNTPRTLSSLTFGDTNTATAGSWLVDNNADPLNILTLAGTPTITVTALGTLATAEITAEIAGTGGLAKAGAGTLTLSGLNTYSGTTSVNAGTLKINSATAIGTGPLTLAGGNLGTSGAAVTLTTNNLQTWGANFTFSGPSNLNLGTGAVGTDAVAREITIDAGVLTIGGVITSPGLTKSGAGQLALTANNLTTLTGDKTLKGGILALGGAQANVQNSLGVTTGTLTFEGGTLTLNQGTFNSTSWGTLANPITVAAGQTGTLNCFPRGAITSALSGAGTLNLGLRDTRCDFNANLTGFTGTLNVSSTISPAFGDLRVNGTGQFTGTKLHLGANVYMSQIFNPPNNTAGTTQSIGQLSGDVGSILAGQPVNGRFVNWSIGALNNDSTFAGAIQNGTGAGRIIKVGLGTLTLTGNNTYTGNAAGIAGTQVTAGTLSIGNGGATGSLGATDTSVAAGAALVFNRDNTSVSNYPGILSGAGTVTKLGNGQVNFNGANTYTAGTTLKGGTLGINSASSLGNAAGAVNFTDADGGIAAQAAGIVSSRTFTVGSGITATFTSVAATDSHQITSVIEGAGSLAIGGSGFTVLGGANTYAGPTTVSSGTLVAANLSGSATSGGAVTVNGGTVGGAGSIAGPVSLAAGAALKPGALTTTTSAVGTLTTGALSLAGGITLHAEFTNLTTYDKISAASLSATASVGDPILVDLRGANSPAKWTALGTYNLIELGSPFVGVADDLFEVTAASQQAGRFYTFGVSGNFITLTITGTPPSVWKVDTIGNWTDAGKWLNGVPNSNLAGAEFTSAITAPRTVTLDANQTVGAITFDNASAYTIDGTFTLNLDAIAGNAQAGVVNGDHVISADLALVDPLDLSLAHAADSLALSGDISGAGGISKLTAGDLILGGNNTFLGNVAFSNGTLSFANGGLGSGTALSLDAATLVWDGANDQDITVGRSVTFGNNPVVFRSANHLTLANNFGAPGTATLTKEGPGNLTLTANTTFSGAVTVAGGNLILGSGATTGSVTGAIALTSPTSRLVIKRGDTPVFNNLISGTGGLDLTGAGNVTLGAANTFAGRTTIASGSLILGNTLALQGSTLEFDTLGGTLNFGTQTAVTLGGLANGVNGGKNLALDNITPAAVTLTVGGSGESTTYGGILSGNGSLIKVGAGVLTLTAPHTYAGFTAANGGTLELAAGSTITTTTASVGAAGFLLVTGGNLTASTLSEYLGGGANGIRIESGTVAYNGGLQSANADASVCTVNGGSFSTSSLTLRRTGSYGTGANPVPAAAFANGFVVNGGTASITGAFTIGTSNSAASALITGGTTTVGGVVTVGNTTNTRWSMLEIRGGTFTAADAVSGLVLSPNATTPNPSQFLVSGGTATVERIGFGATGSAAGTGRVTVSSGTLFIGAGGMEQVPAAFTSQVQLFGGTLAAKANWSTLLPVDTAGTFTLQASDALATPFNITLGGNLTGTGSLVKTGEGTVTLTVPGLYAGNTTVSDGTLSLAGDTLEDTSVVDVSATNLAILNLNYVGTDVVRKFSIDGVPQAVGTWGRLGSLATHTTARITGDGILNVVPDPFFDWIAGYPVGALKGKNDDADGDGLSNLQEFAFDSDPASGAASGKIRSQVEAVGADQALVITLPVRAGAVFAGSPDKSATIDKLGYTIEGSNNLAAFDQGITEIAASAAGMPPLSGSGWTYRSFRLDGAIPARGDKGFLRIDVSAAP